MFCDLKPYSKVSATVSGHAPAHWEHARVKAILRETDLRGVSEEFPLLSLTRSRGLILQSDASSKAPSAAEFSKYKKCIPGQIVMNRMQAWSGMFARATLKGAVSPDYAVFSVVGSNEPNYITNLLKAPRLVAEFAVRSKGIGTGFNRLYSDQLGAVAVSIPPTDEQAAIVKYLGHAHARIDRAIAAKRKLIALLEEQKQAIIHEAVTRGIDPSVPLKDSGIPWLGEIPVQWEVRRAKYLFKEFDSRSGTGLERLLSLRATAGLVFHDEVSDRLIGPEVLTKYKKVRPGHLVMNRMRAASGLFAVATTEGLVSPDYSTMEVSKAVDARYYLRLFKTRAAMAEFRQQSSGLGTGESGFMRLYSESFGRIPLPMPSLAEQEAISGELAALEQEVNEVTIRVSREIELLREFRTRLTSDVVTGQVDVREIAATLPELIDDLLASADDELGDDDELIESELEFAGVDG